MGSGLTGWVVARDLVVEDDGSRSVRVVEGFVDDATGCSGGQS